MRIDMFEKTIGNETEQLMYLRLAEDMGLHLVDFMDETAEASFTQQHTFYYFKPTMYNIIRASTDIRSWGAAMKDSFAADFRLLSEDIEYILGQAEELDQESTKETICSYIGANEYVYYCYERLVLYVDRFYIPEVYNRESFDYEE